MEVGEVKRKLSTSSQQGSDQLMITKRLKSIEEARNGAGNATGSADSTEDHMLKPVSSGSLKSESSSCSMKSIVSKSDMSDVENDVKNVNFGDSDNPHPVDSTAEMDTQRLEDPDEYPETVDMASQPPDEDRDMFDESLCFKEDSTNSEKCVLLRRISDAILGYDDVDGPSSMPNEADELKVEDIVTYLQRQVDQATQADIAKYLSSGSLEYIKLGMQNIHHFYHVATCLRLKQLRDHCLNFCFVNNQTEVVSKFEGCGCHTEIRRESTSGYQRSQSVISNPDDNEPPQYYIVFSGNSADDSETQKEKRSVSVMVIDMSEKLNVFNKEMKVRHFGDGFACCSCEIKESPYVFVSGGVEKGSQMMKYDVLLGRWQKCAKMVHGRSQHMMLAVGEDTIFSLSGHEVPCIEEYDIKHNKWCDRVSLITHVVSAATIYFQNKIYIFGGKTPAGPVATVQCYDVTNHTIERLPDLPCSFDGGKCVEFKGRIFIATDHGHMICYDPSTGTSLLCSRQPVQRRQFGMFVKNDRIYLVGGVICNVEVTRGATPQYRYNAEKDTWVEKYKLCHSFPVLASCIINYPKKCSIIPFNEEF